MQLDKYIIKLWGLSFAIAMSTKLKFFIIPILPEKLILPFRKLKREVSCIEIKRGIEPTYTIIEIEYYKNEKLIFKKRIKICKKCAISILP